MSDWIAKSGGLTQEEMEHNARIVIDIYRNAGFNDKTIAGILGNMQAESSINPQREEVDGSGYGLVQWTPQSVLIDHARNIGLTDYTNGDTQLSVIVTEILGNPSSNNEWYTTQGFINNYLDSGATQDMIGISGANFVQNTMNWSADKLAIMFMVGYERPTTNPTKNHYDKRKQNALNWLEFMGSTPPTPTVTKRKNNIIPIILLGRKRGIF